MFGETTISYVKICVIQLKQPFINGCFRFQEAIHKTGDLHPINFSPRWFSGKWSHFRKIFVACLQQGQFFTEPWSYGRKSNKKEQPKKIHVSHEKRAPTGYFPLNPGCLIGILISWFIVIPTYLGSISFPIYPKQPLGGSSQLVNS